MLRAARRDDATRQVLLVLVITLAAIAMFVATSSAAASDALHSLYGLGDSNRFLSYTLLGNIAIILAGWLRYTRLSAELARRIEAEHEARRLADVDPLTGCLNRRSFLPALEAKMAQAPAAGKRLVLLLIDLDDFKQVNDRYGHVFGDLVLKTVTDRLRTFQTQEGLVARLGGDEFACAVLLPEPHRQEGEELATALIEAMALPISADEANIGMSLTVSIGMVAAEVRHAQPVIDGEMLVNHADIAMYRAKRQGKNRFHWFEPHMAAELAQRRKLEQQMRAGIDAGEFVPFYEQQVDLVTGEIVGFEMLARWRSPDGMVTPETFIPIAEEVGLIAEISEGLISKAFVDAAEWHSDLTLSVNISPIQLRDPWFAQRILKLLVQHNFPPQRLDLEITESCLHRNLDEVRTIILSLRNQGVRVSLDDFGTGYASLNQLRDLSFDNIKIDRSFVSAMASCDSSETIVDAVVQLGTALGLPVTAEGIESKDVVDQLKLRGQLKGQGYYYGHPEDAQAVRQRLAALGRLRNLEQPVLPQRNAPTPTTKPVQEHDSQTRRADAR